MGWRYRTLERYHLWSGTICASYHGIYLLAMGPRKYLGDALEGLMRSRGQVTFRSMTVLSVPFINVYLTIIMQGVPAKDARFAWTFDNLPSSEISSFHTSRGKIKSTFGYRTRHLHQSMQLFWDCENIYTYWQYERALTSAYTFITASTASTIHPSTALHSPSALFPLKPTLVSPGAPRHRHNAETLRECCHLDKKKRDRRVTCSSLDPEIPLATNTVSSSALVFRA
ncbi:hypothetical protein EDD85DRAFT_795385 [Armillaria nabsnona]|nr:hypothetical protein EDD85DRAFT_795385 [Armillaria nabsnona]